MEPSPSLARSVVPRCAVEGGRVVLEGEGLPFPPDRAPDIRFNDAPARVLSASARRLSVVVPSGLEAGPAIVSVEGSDRPLAVVEVGGALTTGLHVVDSPAIDGDGNVYATYSGTRGQRVPVSIFRVGVGGSREPFVSGIVNATSLAFDADGDLYVSSRFDGNIYRVKPDGRVEKFASDLGVACGLAFSPDGTLFVGDRSGTVFRVNAAGRPSPFASLPPSVAAFHLAIDAEEAVYVSAPTLSSIDSIYRVDRRGDISVAASGFGRPQGLAFDRAGRLHVIEALAGASGLYRVAPGGKRELVVSGAGLVGVAFHRERGLVLATNDTLFHIASDPA
jgi:sugar lactone lactonase YvrE